MDYLESKYINLTINNYLHKERIVAYSIKHNTPPTVKSRLIPKAEIMLLNYAQN
jgi:hypothetical protein